MVSIKTKDEINILREGGRLLAGILEKVVKEVKPGVSTLELDRLAEGLIFASGGAPAFKGYRGKGDRTPYPRTLCTSLNDEIVHGIPRADKILKNGDVIGIDIGMKWPVSAKAVENKRAGLYTDMAITVGVGKISPEAEKLLKGTRESLMAGIAVVRSGIKVGDIGYAVQKHLEKYKLGIIRNLAGHGVGYEVHEEPLIPNYGQPGTGLELKEGMVLAIEPMASLGGWKLELAEDQWGYKTMDGSLTAHFEHTVAVTANGVEILTTLR